jgi:hypothetical protein
MILSFLDKNIGLTFPSQDPESARYMNVDTNPLPQLSSDQQLEIIVQTLSDPQFQTIVPNTQTQPSPQQVQTIVPETHSNPQQSQIIVPQTQPPSNSQTIVPQTETQPSPQQQHQRQTVVPQPKVPRHPRTLQRIRHALRRLPHPEEPPKPGRTFEEWEAIFGKYEPMLAKLVDKFEKDGGI